MENGTLYEIITNTGCKCEVSTYQLWIRTYYHLGGDYVRNQHYKRLHVKIEKKFWRTWTSFSGWYAYTRFAIYNISRTIQVDDAQDSGISEENLAKARVRQCLEGFVDLSLLLYAKKGLLWDYAVVRKEDENCRTRPLESPCCGIESAW